MITIRNCADTWSFVQKHRIGRQKKWKFNVITWSVSIDALASWWQCSRDRVEYFSPPSLYLLPFYSNLLTSLIPLPNLIFSLPVNFHHICIRHFLSYTFPSLFFITLPFLNILSFYFPPSRPFFTFSCLAFSSFPLVFFPFSCLSFLPLLFRALPSFPNFSPSTASKPNPSPSILFASSSFPHSLPYNFFPYPLVSFPFCFRPLLSSSLPSSWLIMASTSPSAGAFVTRSVTHIIEVYAAYVLPALGSREHTTTPQFRGQGICLDDAVQ